MKFKTWEIVSRAVEEGIDHGCQRALKHTDTPSQELLKESIYDSVMNELSEVIEFSPQESSAFY